MTLHLMQVIFLLIRFTNGRKETCGKGGHIVSFFLKSVLSVSQCSVVLYSKTSSSSRRFSVEDIPEDEQECAGWLHKLYQEKVNRQMFKW